jgi:hypothetical protein
LGWVDGKPSRLRLITPVQSDKSLDVMVRESVEDGLVLVFGQSERQLAGHGGPVTDLAS